MPKSAEVDCFRAAALLVCHAVQRQTKDFAAVARWMSFPSAKASTGPLSRERCAIMRSSICE